MNLHPLQANPSISGRHKLWSHDSDGNFLFLYLVKYTLFLGHSGSSIHCTRKTASTSLAPTEGNLREPHIQERGVFTIFITICKFSSFFCAPRLAKVINRLLKHKNWKWRHENINVWAHFYWFSAIRRFSSFFGLETMNSWNKRQVEAALCFESFRCSSAICKVLTLQWPYWTNTRYVDKKNVNVRLNYAGIICDI